MKKIKKSSFIVVTFLLLASAMCIFAYNTFMKPNTFSEAGESSLFIYSNSNFSSVKDSLYRKNLIINKKSFELTARLLNYPKYIKSGHYVIKSGLGNYKLVSMLRSGCQKPVKVIFNNVRDIEQLSGKIGRQIEPDSLSLLNAIRNSKALKAKGFDNQTLPALFLPNTYEFYWDCTANEFIDRMCKEYDAFWNENRRKAAESIGLSPIEISILASIVDKETTKTSEMSRIAGVYLNRLKKHWLLQADPTLVFAIGNYDVHRVLDIHKNVDSPYNTYIHVGLPPGPICIPSIASIEAVLHAEQHKYFYFCAKDDLSGYHVFARNISEHNANAERYRRALNRNRIWK